MKQAVIDIGSNSMRLTVYETTQAGSFSILFKDKIMAGLAGYVEEGVLTSEGVSRAVFGLNSFRQTLEALDIPDVWVFATASLRNIKNTAGAVSAIQEATGFSIQVVSGEEEARFGYLGAMEDLDLQDGLFADIGGASTEVVRFAQGKMGQAVSCPVGSLKLYRDWVKKILPGKKAVENMTQAIVQATQAVEQTPLPPGQPLVCVGGTARAALKLARRVCRLPQSTNRITRDQLCQVCARLCGSQKEAADLILKIEPERIHTILPGLLILRHLVETFGAGEIVVSRYGVREGYLCQQIRPTPITATPKTAS